jgi:hypothetical protein
MNAMADYDLWLAEQGREDSAEARQEFIDLRRPALWEEG